jgi:hypothetical protein
MKRIHKDNLKFMLKVYAIFTLLYAIFGFLGCYTEDSENKKFVTTSLALIGWGSTTLYYIYYFLTEVYKKEEE